MLKSSLLVALAAFVAPASAAFTYVPFILGSTSTETFSAGECKVFAVNVTRNDAASDDDSMTPSPTMAPLSASTGTVDKTLLRAEVDGGQLEYIAYLTPYESGVEWKQGSSTSMQTKNSVYANDLTNNPYIIFPSPNNDCWATAMDVDKQGIYTNVPSQSAGPLVFDTNGQGNDLTYSISGDCDMQAGDYFVVMKAKSSSGTSASVKISTVSDDRMSVCSLDIGAFIAMILTAIFVPLGCCCCCGGVLVWYCACYLPEKKRKAAQTQAGWQNNQAAAVVVVQGSPVASSTPVVMGNVVDYDTKPVV